MTARRSKTENTEPLRIGICGCGAYSRFHVRNYLKIPGVRIVALADIRYEAATRLRDQELVPAGFPAAIFHSLEEMVNIGRLDAVSIITPHTLHYPQALHALSRGLHVLVEKPMTTTTAHAEQLARVSKRMKRVLAIGNQGPSSPEFRYIRSVVASGELGPIQSVFGYLTRNTLFGLKGTWRLDPALSGGGELTDAGAHLFTAMFYLSGLEPDEVFALADDKGEKVDITSSVVVKFRGGAQGTFHVTGDSPLFSNSLELHFRSGVIQTGMYGDFVRHYVGSNLVKYPPVPAGVTTNPQANFIAAIRGLEEPACPPELGVKLCRFMEAVYRSIHTGRPVKVRG
jgi:predicted dehydrogenase